LSSGSEETKVLKNQAAGISGSPRSTGQAGWRASFVLANSSPRLRLEKQASAGKLPFSSATQTADKWKEKGVASQEEEPGFSRTATPELPACALEDSHVPACVPDGTPAGRRLIARPTTLSSLRAVR